MPNSGDDKRIDQTTVRRTIAIVDLVESVRIMQLREADTIARWRRFVAVARASVLPRFGGRMVKSLGDGMLLEFERPRAAVEAVQALHAALHEQSSDLPADSTLCLRAGIHVAEVVVDEVDIFGAGVNLTARLATLAGPGETVVSVDMRDELDFGALDDLEDLGECFLKHIDAKVRAFRVGSPGSAPVMNASREDKQAELRLSVAVFKLRDDTATSTGTVWERFLADEIAGLLSANPSIRVISRLSSSLLDDQTQSPQQIAAALGASYLVSGSCVVSGDRVMARLNLVDGQAAHIVWSTRIVCSGAELLAGEARALTSALDDMLDKIRVLQIGRVVSTPVPSLQSWALMHGAIGMLHAATPSQFDRSRHLLEHLVDRHQRLAQPRAWLSKWHLLSVVNGLVADPLSAADRALSEAHRALAANPDNALALAIDGQVTGFLTKDLKTAEARHRTALSINPSEPLAWLFLSAVQAWRGDGIEAVDSATTALSLSPLDPLRYYFETFAAFAHLAAGQHREAVRLAEMSLRRCRSHTPTYRTLAIAEVMLGNESRARETVQRMQALEPGFCVSKYLDRYPGSDTTQRATFAHALRVAGATA